VYLVGFSFELDPRLVHFVSLMKTTSTCRQNWLSFFLQ